MEAFGVSAGKSGHGAAGLPIKGTPPGTGVTIDENVGVLIVKPPPLKYAVGPPLGPVGV